MQDKTTVDDGLSNDEAGWEFDESIAREFDEHVRKSIPNYDEVHKQVCKLTDWFVRSDSDNRIYDLGCATGETLERLDERHSDTHIEYVGIDINEAMLSVARERLADTRAQLINRDLSSGVRLTNATVVISLFTMSFLPEQDRCELIRHIYDELPKGGAFIFCEKTRSESSTFQDIWNEHYWDFKQDQGLTEEQIMGKAKTLRGQLRPLQLSEYKHTLRDIGFSDIDVWYKWYPWSGVLARK